MKHRLSTRLLALGVALSAIGSAAALVPAAHGGTTAKGTVVALKKTSLGTILVDARGRTLYLFEKDRGGMSACNSACVQYWPALTSRGAPRAGSGVHQSMLRVVRQRNGVRQVTYAGHPLYTFVGDKSAGQTSGEGLTNFGAGWYAIAASGRKVEESQSSSGSSSSSSSGGYGSSSSGGYGSSSGYGW